MNPLQFFYILTSVLFSLIDMLFSINVPKLHVYFSITSLYKFDPLYVK